MNNPFFRKALLAVIIACASLTTIGCGSKVEGTYSNVNGSIMLELKSGGKASLTILGEAEACTYKVDGKTVTLDCKGHKTVFTIHDDGSLTGPPGSMIGALRKSKS